MTDIVARLKNVNDRSLIMQVVRDCMDAAHTIEELRAELDSKSEELRSELASEIEGLHVELNGKSAALKNIMDIIHNENRATQERAKAHTEPK
ncbi:hypothetical protein [Magnetovibrio blakemorei]|uniref:hypothetical protein n=1 Tax=Magnetovibrio blakemorei TaxID=28181 RepID=UPI001112DF76|nr:hypothetical protein [Magnetovibrio blakemorei]